MKRLSEVQSICPVCEKPIKAFYTEREGKVFFEKTCEEHGEFRALVSNRTDDYLDWIKNPVVNIPPKTAMTKGSGQDECPLHCGTCENHLQTACCVLIDITKRCNQHCPFCFARAEMDSEEPGDPSLKELEAKFDLLVELGEERPFNIQLSGGEPTVRDDLPQIIRMARSKGFEYIQINSNGRRIAREAGYAAALKEAGASVIFMQFDGTTDEIYMQMRGEPLFKEKKQAIENCRKAGLPVTLVPTVARNVNLDNIGAMMEFLLENIAVVKGIHFQPVSFFGRHPDPDHENRVTMFDVLHEIENQCPGFHYEDFCPIATGHTLCCFYSTYLKEKDGITCMVSKKEKEAGISCCDTQQDSCCCEPDPLEIIKKDRDFVLNKWDLPQEQETSEVDCCSCCEPADTAAAGEEPCCQAEQEEEIMDLDQFLTYYKQNTFTVTGMAFQDSTNLDAERLKRCRVQVLSADNRLVPFCGYNSIYRKS
ncbi:radical SAM protein [Hominibacterium faecale]|uniref:radical SAM protein n=1 Tax=Hominibacterium faecale TaxID=2839743 RepID=UPI0022B29638|nr:radical SAM protein [Hominibacterium faecale]